jgi:O-phosphoseryl-tRNA synthetase
MRLDTKKIVEEAERDFEKAWAESVRLLPEGGGFELKPKAKRHPLWEVIERARRVLLEMGFAETLVPTLVHKYEVYRQYGPQAPIILDRIFFLSVLERPDIGISGEKEEELRKISERLDVGALQRILRRYKLGEIPSDDLPEVVMEELGLSEEQAGRVLSLFKEFKELQPQPTEMTLRSHTTAGWFTVLREMMKREPLPLQLFSIGPKYRREQRLDSSHLYESWTASLVVMAEELGLADGIKITREFLRRMGYEKVELKTKKATSKYYAPQTEFEVFVAHPKTGEPVEVGDGGMYSPIALANYEIPYPVFNLGVGLERLAMVETGERDIRVLVYPYLYQAVSFTDEQLARMVRPSRAPVTGEGMEIAGRIERVAREKKDEVAPCSFLVWEGNLLGRRVRVEIFEHEEGKKLVGPAGFNELYVYQGNLIGIPLSGWERAEEIRKGGVPVGMSYMRAFALLAAASIEEACRQGKNSIEVEVKNIKNPSDINLRLEEPFEYYVTSHQKKIDVRGPFFTTVRALIE